MEKVLTIVLLVAILAGVVALLLIPGEEILLDDGGSKFRKSVLRFL